MDSTRRRLLSLFMFDILLPPDTNTRTPCPCTANEDFHRVETAVNACWELIVLGGLMIWYGQALPELSKGNFMQDEMWRHIQSSYIDVPRSSELRVSNLRSENPFLHVWFHHMTAIYSTSMYSELQLSSDSMTVYHLILYVSFLCYWQYSDILVLVQHGLPWSAVSNFLPYETEIRAHFWGRSCAIVTTNDHNLPLRSTAL